MKKTFVTYGDDNYRESLERIGREARATGVFDSVRLYTPADLPEPFASYTRDYPRGGGYWLWKPFVIVSELDRAAEGDIVVYADAGCTLMPHADWQRYFDASTGARSCSSWPRARVPSGARKRCSTISAPGATHGRTPARCRPRSSSPARAGATRCSGGGTTLPSPTPNCS